MKAAGVNARCTRRAFLTESAALAFLPGFIPLCDIKAKPSATLQSIVTHHIKAGAGRPFSLLHLSGATIPAAVGRGEFEVVAHTSSDALFLEMAGKRVLSPRQGCVSAIINGVNFVALDNEGGDISELCAARFKAEVKKGRPIILLLRRPLVEARGFVSARTSSFVGFLHSLPLLKGIVVSGSKDTCQREFSPGVKEYILGGNLHGEVERIVIS